MNTPIVGVYKDASGPPISKGHDMIIPANIEAAVAVLREAGWTVLEPVIDTIPEPEVGQVWVAPSRRVNRKVLRIIGTDLRYIAHGYVVSSRCSRAAWRAWAKRTGARPV